MEKINYELEDLIRCEICKKTYESPVILPCLNTICENHISFGLKYDCVFCANTHVTPEDGFPTDMKILKLIKMNNDYININKINYGKINRNAKDSCKLLEDLLEQTQTLVGDPLYFIDSYFSRLKNEIDLKREEYVMLIETNHDHIIKEIEKFEKQCKHEAKEKSLNLFDLIKTSKAKLTKWNADLKIPDFDRDGNWKRIAIRAREESEKLKLIMVNFQDELLLNKEVKFSPKQIVGKNNFGDLVFFDREKMDTNRSEASFQLIIDDFNSFRRNYEWRESSKPCIIKNIPWKINAKIEQTEDFDLALGFYVYPEFDDNKLRQNPISAEIKLKIIQDKSVVNSKVKLYRRFLHKYTESIGSGCPAFILLRDIMDPVNGLYDRRNDSITLETTVKIIDND